MRLLPREQEMILPRNRPCKHNFFYLSSTNFIAHGFKLGFFRLSGAGTKAGDSCKMLRKNLELPPFVEKIYAFAMNTNTIPLRAIPVEIAKE